MIYSFKNKSNTSLNRLLFFASLGLMLLLFFAVTTHTYKLYTAKNTLQMQWNAQELRIDSLLAVKLLADKELAQTKAALESVKSENQKLQAVLAEANASIILRQHIIDRLLGKETNKTNPVNQQPKTGKSKLQQQSLRYKLPDSTEIYLPAFYRNSFAGTLPPTTDCYGIINILPISI